MLILQYQERFINSPGRKGKISRNSYKNIGIVQLIFFWLAHLLSLCSHTYFRTCETCDKPNFLGVYKKVHTKKESFIYQTLQNISYIKSLVW